MVVKGSFVPGLFEMSSHGGSIWVICDTEVVLMIIACFVVHYPYIFMEGLRRPWKM